MGAKAIALPGPFVEWLDGTGPFQEESKTELVELQQAVAGGRRRRHGREGYSLTIALDGETVLKDLVEYTGYFESAIADESSAAEKRAHKTMVQRLADL